MNKGKIRLAIRQAIEVLEAYMCDKKELKTIALLREALLELDAKQQGVKFPLQYKGWTVEIAMGNKLGRRGYAARGRGYIATHTSGYVYTSKPTYDGSASLAELKRILDVKTELFEVRGLTGLKEQ